ncbi:hypothetical protein [Streptomyces sp. NPDC005805]|uniref:hypothetical protein n=1 Tax=Streptomyces sp. NPDC005805 TaxID=3157068 RepID=UPI0033D43BE3
MVATARHEARGRERAETPLRWAGALTGLAVNWLVPFSPDADVDLLYGFPVFGLCVMAGVLAAHLVARPRPAPVRMAGLAPRRVRDAVPRGLTTSLAAQALVLVGVLVAATATADAGGRALTVSCATGTRTLAPWPGPHYAWPVLGGLALGTLVCLLLLRSIVLRPGDDAQRRVSARAAVGAWGVLVSAPLFAVCVTVATVVLMLPCAGAAKAAALWGLGSTALVAALTAGHCLAVLLLPQVYHKERA